MKITNGWIAGMIVMLVAVAALFASDIRVHNAAEIESAMQTAEPGDTLTMVNGLWMDEDIDFEGNGTQENPILLRAETPGHVVLSGRSRLKIDGSYLVVDGLYFLHAYMVRYKVHLIDFGSQSYRCRLTNTVMIDCNPDDWGLFYKWVRAKGTHHRIDHCYFSGKNHQDALLKIVVPNNGPSYSRIDHCYFADLPPGKTGNGWETIRIQGPEIAAGHTIVEDNLFYRCDGEGEIISLKAGENDLRRNTFLECMGSLTCRKNVGNRIYNNFFIGNHKYGTGGIRMYSKDHVIYNNYFENLNGDNEWRGALSYMTAQVGVPEVENVLAAFNTMVNCKYSIEIGVGRSSGSGRIVPPRNLKFANNIVYNPDGELVHYRETVTGMVYEGNIMYGPPVGIPVPAGIDTVDPVLVEDADGLWRPGAGSPAIDAAVGAYAQVTVDMDEQPREDGSHDVGADEQSNKAITNRPLTADDVGPAWIQRPDLPVALAVTQTGGGSGTITLDPPHGIYTPGTVVTLTAETDTLHQFQGWSGDLSGTENPITIVMDAHKSVQAVFKPPLTFQISLWYVGEGEVELDPAGGTYFPGDVVDVTAVPDEGWQFSHWSGGLGGSENPATLTLGENVMIIANFEQITGIAAANAMPTEYRLWQNYPNPFNPSTTISFDLKQPGLTTLKIFDAKGQQVAVLINEYMPSGHHRVQFNAHHFAAGVYICKIRSGSFSAMHKMVLVK